MPRIPVHFYSIRRVETILYICYNLLTKVEIIEVDIAAGLACCVVEECEFGAHEVSHVVESHRKFVAD